MSVPVPVFQPLKGGAEFGLILAAARKEIGLSQAQMAERINVVPATVSFRETYRRRVNVDDAIVQLGVAGYGLVIVPLQASGRRAG